MPFLNVTERCQIAPRAPARSPLPPAALPTLGITQSLGKEIMADFYFLLKSLLFLPKALQ